MRSARPRVGLLVRCCFIGALALSACGQPAATTTVPVHRASPKPVSTAVPTVTPEPSPSPTPTAPPLPVAIGIHVPAGFRAFNYAEGIYQPTAMAFGPDGRLYIASAAGHVSVVDTPGATPRLLVSGLPPTLGLAWRDDRLFVAVRGSVVAYTLTGNQLAGGAPVVSGLPGGEHQVDNLLMLGNGDFLLGVGSTCDLCVESDARSASVLRFHADWSYDGIVLRGSRNPYGLANRLGTGTTYVTINGQDALGAAQPADELVEVRDGEDAGWPRCWPAFPTGILYGSCSGVTAPVAVFAPHASADGIVFYEAAQFGPDYLDNAFVTEWGTYFGTGTGRKVVRVVMRQTNGPERGQVTDFATGFQHPLPVMVGPDGGLLVGDYGSGRIYEIRRLG